MAPLMILNATLSQRTKLGMLAGLALSVVLTFCFTLWQWHIDWALSHQTILAAMPMQNDTANMITALPKTHLFGQSLAGDMPISSLQLHVTGIVKVENENGGVSKAYISMSGQPSKIYQVGDELPYGVKVYAITSDTIVLSRDGQLEKLPLAREKLAFKAHEDLTDMDEGPY